VTAPRDRLFTAPFFAMCGYSFTVFLSLFQLLPTAPFHIEALGGSRLQSGLFLGLLTYSSAFSAPVTGALADRLGRTRQLLVCSLAIAGFSMLYAVAPSVPLLLVLVPIHGIVWSGLLSASGAYLTGILPPGRRVEGIAYWGMASVVALAIGPVVGFWLFHAAGWTWLCAEATVMNLVMAFIATRLDEPPRAPRAAHEDPAGHWIEWRVLLLSIPLFMYSYAYGAITSFSAIYADEIGVRPKSLFLTTLAVAILVTRPVLGRFGDRLGYRRLFAPCLVAMAAGLTLLTTASSRTPFVCAAIIFGIGYGIAYPVFVGYVTHTVGEHRRGAAFGAILAAFDTGIGTGSTLTGWISGHGGLGTAFGVAAGLAACALPAFLVSDRFVGRALESASRPRASTPHAPEPAA
jgi:MFS family permease